MESKRMNVVSGIASYSVLINCPFCNDTFDVIGTENDDDNCVTGPMFKNTIKSCTNMDIEITCPTCDGLLILDELIY